MHSALLDALAVLLPVECAGCGAADRSVCAACRAALAQPVIHSRTPGGLHVRSALRYEGSARRLILGLKEGGRTDAVRTLRAHLTPLINPACVLVPVPSSRAALRRRGYDPVRLLAGRPLLRVLTVARDSAAQKLLGVDERARNRAGTLRATRPLAGRQCVILDDVVTTGSTIDEAARALRQAGATVTGAVTLAATPRYFAPSPREV